MKNLLICTLFMFAFGSCEKENKKDTAGFTCIFERESIQSKSALAAKKIIGTWKLQAILGGFTGEVVPITSDQVLEISSDSITVISNRTFTKKVKFVLNEIDKGSNYTVVKLIAEGSMIDSIKIPSSLDGEVRVCDDELMLDHGMERDGPASLYRRVNTSNH